MNNMQELLAGIALGTFAGYSGARAGHAIADILSKDPELGGGIGCAATGIGGALTTYFAQGRSRLTAELNLATGALIGPYTPQYANGFVIGDIVGVALYGVHKLDELKSIKSGVSQGFHHFGGAFKAKIDALRKHVPENYLKKLF